MPMLNCCNNIEKRIEYDYPRLESRALNPNDTADTFLGRLATELSTGKPDYCSGFRTMADGTDALATRLLMARKAEKSIDAQYYLIKDDVVGGCFLHTLMQAADRGVRVRFLLDDMFTKGYDRAMAALCAHPNFELRIFNPFQRSLITERSLVGTARDFQRINRRMHNKTFIVDNQMAVIGGRNMADEYFGVNKTAKFHDDDVLAVGPVVHDVSATFDRYWNHETALPALAFVKKLDDPMTTRDVIRDKLAKDIEEAKDSKYSEAIRAKTNEKLICEADSYRWAPYQLVADSPNKGVPTRAERRSLKITTPLIASLHKAKERLIVISPYFVPTEKDVEEFSSMKKNGVEVIIVTNSLAANNMFMVHGGYAPVRKPLLKAGVKIYEVRADSDVPGSEYVDAKKAVTTLHTKEFMVDSKEAFIGSFNFDPRSAKLNTECGVIIRDSELTDQLSQQLLDKLPTQTFELFLNEQGRLRWRTTDNNEQSVFNREPQTSFMQRVLGNLARIVPKSQL
jgi:putative cardiolipin synthase